MVVQHRNESLHTHFQGQYKVRIKNKNKKMHTVRLLRLTSRIDLFIGLMILEKNKIVQTRTHTHLIWFVPLMPQT